MKNAVTSALRNSLRLRLLAGTLFWIAASIIAAGWGLSSLFQRHVEVQFHAELKTYLDQLTAQLTLDGKGQRHGSRRSANSTRNTAGSSVGR